MLGFKLDGKLRLPHPEFDCERVRYEHRFAPFNGLMTPPPVQHSEYRDMAGVLQQSGSTSLYLAGCKHFHQARAFLDSISPSDNEVLTFDLGQLNLYLLVKNFYIFSQ